jgi:hypothetical protein
VQFDAKLYEAQMPNIKVYLFGFRNSPCKFSKEPMIPRAQSRIKKETSQRTGMSPIAEQIKKPRQ